MKIAKQFSNLSSSKSLAVEKVVIQCVDINHDYLKLKHPFRKTTAGPNSLSFLGPSKWNKLPEPTKKCSNINTFKHNFKKLYPAQLAN